MAENKTKPTKADVAAFLASVAPEGRRADAVVLDGIFRKITGETPALWGPSIIGYGRYAYRYDSGREGEMCRTGYSPRKANLVIYVLTGFEGADALLARLGRHKIGKSCLYLNRLADVDAAALEELIAQSWAEMARRYPAV